jgi:hypothetical protein
VVASLRATIGKRAFVEFGNPQTKGRFPMRRLTLILAAATLALGAMALEAGAQNHRLGSAGVLTLKNATPIVKEVACGGYTGGYGCGPGWTWSRRWHRCVRC